MFARLVVQGEMLGPPVAKWVRLAKLGRAAPAGGRRGRKAETGEEETEAGGRTVGPDWRAFVCFSCDGKHSTPPGENARYRVTEKGTGGRRKGGDTPNMLKEEPQPRTRMDLDDAGYRRPR